jgi:hypothetical protein
LWTGSSELTHWYWYEKYYMFPLYSTKVEKIIQQNLMEIKRKVNA